MGDRTSHEGRKSLRAQTSTIGVILLFGITIIGTTAIVTYGSTAISDTQENSQTIQAGHAMTLLDARAATAALGQSTVQTVRLGTAEGTYRVRPNSGRIKITHMNFTGTGDNETIYDAKLGAVTYHTGDTTIAYQGGGVWRRSDNGSTMLSTPEFHYRSATLTLPVIRVEGSGGVSNNPVGVIRSQKRARQIYPNLTASPTVGSDEVGAPYNGTDDPYHNPVRNGTVRVTITSEYYEGWASFFRTRTAGNVSTNHTSDEVSVDLRTAGLDGRFDMPPEGGSLNLDGLADGHAVNDFSMTLRPTVNAGGNIAETGFNNLEWSLYGKKGNKEVEFHIASTGKQKCHPSPSFNTLELGVYYSNESSPQHEWENTSIDPNTGDFRVECTDLDGDSKDEPQLILDLTGSTQLEYGDTSMDDWHFDQSPSAAGKAPLEGHLEHGEDVTISTGGETSIDHLTNHYIALMSPSVELVVDDNSPGGGAGDRLGEEESFGNLDLEHGGDKFITFLHITENEVVVEFN